MQMEYCLHGTLQTIFKGMTAMSTQKNIFLSSEGDEWYKRNLSAIENKKEEDPVLKIMALYDSTPKKTLEIGCSNGWRLSRLEKATNSQCFGIDPSSQAIEDGKEKYPHIQLKTGSADDIPFEKSMFDCVILGYCLYLCDRDDLFKIAYEVDRVLQDNGIVVIYDFCTEIPYYNRYQYHDNIQSFKMAYAKLFTWNPFYRTICSINMNYNKAFSLEIPKDDQINITLLKKDKKNAYIMNPYLP